MFKRSLIMVLCLVPSLLAAESTLDRYVQEGLRSNLSLKQNRLSYQGSQQQVLEARSRFYPTISFSGRYSRAAGGRTIDLPIGDLLNPIHEALNAEGYGPFPTDLGDESIATVPEAELDARLRLAQPIYNSQIINGYGIQKSLSRAREQELDAVRNQLVREVKSAYFSYLMAVKVVELLEATRPLLLENLRVSERLVAAQSATEEVVYRSRAELAGLDSQLEEALKNRELAASYFNFLLNRPLDAAIDTVEAEEGGRPADASPFGLGLEQLQQHALAGRPELRQLGFALEAAQGSVKLAAGQRLPTVSGVFDYGIQGQDLNLDADSDYWMASLIVEWQLFDGMGRAARRQQAELERRQLLAGLEELQIQIRLNVQEAYRAVLAAGKEIESSGERLASERKSFEIIRKKYENGLVSQIEFIETRTSLTDAEVQHILARYDYQIRLAELEEAAALYGRGPGHNEE